MSTHRSSFLSPPARLELTHTLPRSASPISAAAPSSEVIPLQSVPELKKVAIIGAGGHVGLPLSLVIADSGFQVTGIDLNLQTIRTLENGSVPFVEDGAEHLLAKVLRTGSLKFTTSYESIAESDTVVLIIGTPVDANLNPRIDSLLDVVEQNMSRFHENQLIVLRSTVSPGTTELVKDLIEDLTGMTEGEDFFVVFAPERVLQTKAIEEIRGLPQLVGAFSEASFRRAEDFFSGFIDGQCIMLQPVESEIGKLITNMARYVSFALANEFYLIADAFGANMHRIVRACNQDYPRLDLPSPGPNVGGPCLYKDGYYLVDKLQFPDIITTSFKINESIPMYLLEKVRGLTDIKKAAILGMTFKPNCDDTRNSLSYKLRKHLRGMRAEIVEVDPYVPGAETWDRLAGADALFLMTPHREFRDLQGILAKIDNPNCVVVDMWDFWDENESLSHDGIYRAYQVTSGTAGNGSKTIPVQRHRRPQTSEEISGSGDTQGG